jgi:heptosyltransferase-3
MSKNIQLDNKRIIISRTDSIGDVMLTLPICSWIKNHFKNTHIIFLASAYTHPVIACYQDVDEIVDWKSIQEQPTQEKINVFRALKADVIIHVFPNKEIASLAKKAKIHDRIGTSHRTFHFLTCNHRLNFTRKKSPYHEAQLNFELLRPFGLKALPTMEDLNAFTTRFQAPKVDLPEWLKTELSHKSVILHGKSQGSAVEWGLKNYQEAANFLVEKGYKVFFTGTEKEGVEIRKEIQFNENINDTTGKLTLTELIQFISECQHLVACSTGPFHIAGYLGIHSIGLFSPRKPIHPGRWKALGKNVTILIFDENCVTCGQGKPCSCIEQIQPQKVVESIVSSN